MEVGGVMVAGIYPTTATLKIEGFDVPHLMALSLRRKRVFAIRILLPNPPVSTVD
jgi:hypothetical protein